MKKALLGIAITICLLVAGSRIYKFYQEHRPPFKVGECFEVTDKSIGTVKFTVESNDTASSSSVIVGRMDNFLGIPGVSIRLPVKVSFKDIRDAEPKKVDCE